MQKILGYLRKACREFDLIGEGDRIAVGVSGGKDSLVLLAGLAKMRSFYPKHYEVCGVTIDPRFGGAEGDYTRVEELCRELDVPYEVVRTDIGEIVFDVRRESNPCSLCAKMRRGALTGAAEKMGCNKLALGHNNDDVIETFVMNLLMEGRIGCFSPKTFFPDRDITVIRPLILAPEGTVLSCAKRNNFPVVKNPCPADKHTNRQKTKEMLAALSGVNREAKQRIFGALRKSGIDGWGFRNEEER